MTGVQTCALPICLVLAASFFFQAEGGIRVVAVTGVQTCALPISVIFSWEKRRYRNICYSSAGGGRIGRENIG